MQLCNVPESRRYWVVRAEGGKYYDHFITKKIVALGHIDILNLPEVKDQPFEPDFKAIDEKLKKIHESQDISKMSTTTHLNQVKSFLYEMNVGDWVITLGSLELRVGRIIGTPRLDKSTIRITYDIEKGHHVDLNYNLRRAVQWGPTILRSNLPYGLIQSLRANQALFNVDKHIYALYHTLYPAFSHNGKLHLSANIRTNYEIKNYYISSFFTFLNEIEVIAKEYENGLTKENFTDYFDSYLENDQLTTTTKAKFHSFGEIWNTITSISGDLNTWQSYCVAAYSMLFGNKLVGFDGIVDLQTRQKIWDIVLSRFGEKRIARITKELDLKSPDYNTKDIEDSSNDEK